MYVIIREEILSLRFPLKLAAGILYTFMGNETWSSGGLAHDLCCWGNSIYQWVVSTSALGGISHWNDGAVINHSKVPYFTEWRPDPERNLKMWPANHDAGVSSGLVVTHENSSLICMGSFPTLKPRLTNCESHKQNHADRSIYNQPVHTILRSYLLASKLFKLETKCSISSDFWNSSSA